MRATLTVVTNGVPAASFHGIHSFVHDGCFEPAGRHSEEPQEPAEARVFWHSHDVGPNSRRDREECTRHDGPVTIGSKQALLCDRPHQPALSCCRKEFAGLPCDPPCSRSLER